MTETREGNQSAEEQIVIDVMNPGPTEGTGESGDQPLTGLHAWRMTQPDIVYVPLTEHSQANPIR